MEFYTNKLILSISAKKVVETSNDYHKEQPTHLPGIRKDVYQQIMQFSYFEKNLQIKYFHDAKELLISEDRFGCVDLKLNAG